MLSSIYLENIQEVTEPCTVVVRVAVSPKLYTGDEYPRYLMLLRVAIPSSIESIYDLFQSSTKPLQFDHIRSFLFTGAIFEGSVKVDELPVRGEKVIATFDYVSGELKCTSITVIPRKKLPYLDVTKRSGLAAVRKTLNK